MVNINEVSLGSGDNILIDAQVTKNSVTGSKFKVDNTGKVFANSINIVMLDDEIVSDNDEIIFL